MDIIDDLLFYEELEAINEIVKVRRPYNTRNRFVPHLNNFDIWDDTDFKRRFRLSKSSIRKILELIGGELQSTSNRNNPITPLQQLLVTLRFYSTGNFYISVADFGGIHKSTAAKIIKRVTIALAHLLPQFVKLPATDNERSDIQVKFREIAMFPLVVGAVDCTHIRIQSPGGPKAGDFRNSKGYFSLNVQVISDANYVIRDIVSRSPGSCHEANIFDNSLVRMKFENNEMGDGVLLGGSAYPLRSYLITPLANPTGEVENLFNESLIRTRHTVERTFGIWKQRFPILSVGIRCQLYLAKHIIAATAILHNIARNNPDDDLPELEDVLDHDIITAPQDNVIQNDTTRKRLIDYFRQLHDRN